MKTMKKNDFLKMGAKAGVGIVVTWIIGQTIRFERRIEERIDDHFKENDFENNEFIS